jgi:Subtilase family
VIDRLSRFRGWLLLALGLSFALLPSAAAASSARPRVGPLPRADYGARAVCRAPATRHAACLAYQLVPKTKEARAHTHPIGVRRAPLATPAAPPSPTTGDFGLRPSDLHSAYDLPTTTAGGQTVAIVDAYNDLAAEEDLALYTKEFSLPACTAGEGCFAKVNQKGEAANLPFPKTAKELETARKGSHAQREEAEEALGWALEISLDIEVTRAVCQSCHIVLVEANSPTYENLETAERTAATLGAGEISNSWGGSEHGVTVEEERKSPFDHPGLVITAAAGDDGYLDWDASSEKGYADYPASSPHVVAVGGTHLSLTESDAWAGEAVWDGYGAGGGGCSVVFPAQPFQRGVPDWSSVGCGEKRAVNDVSAVADPYTGLAVYDSGVDCEYEFEGHFKSHWCTIGGTSLSTPLIAATFALAGGAHGVEYPAQSLYEGELHSPGSLHDITEGSNGECKKGFSEETGLSDCTAAEEAQRSCSSKAICLAGVGYDGPTGVGTPDGLTDFAPTVLTPPTVSTGTASAISQTSATIAGSVNPNGLEVSKCLLEYGPTDEYGHSATCSPAPGAGTSAAAVSAAISSLEPATPYHFRVVATNAGGTSYGQDVSFETLPEPVQPPEAPEFGRCQKVAKGTGSYGNAGCTKPGGSGSYEWLPGVLAKAFTLEATAGAAVLETTAHTEIACTGATGSGEFTGAKALTGVVLTFTGCELSGQTCASGAVAGEIVTAPLAGALGVEKLGAEAAKDKIALHLYTTTASVSQFLCGSTVVSLKGSVLVPVKANKMVQTTALDFKAARGHQKPEGFVEGARDVLEGSFGGAPGEQLGLTLKATLSNGEALEVSSTV